MNIMRNAVSIAALLCVSAVAAPLAPVTPDAWSEAVAGLAGRIRVAEPTITTEQHFCLTLELANRGNGSLAVQSGNPHIFTITLLDGAGKPVQPTSARMDVLSSPQWGVIPGGAYLGLPVSIQSQDGAKGSHLDITTLIWKLSPGKYRICATFSSGSAADLMGSPGKAAIWEGKIVIPPLDIEVVEKK
jgi:hypothetical protein